MSNEIHTYLLIFVSCIFCKVLYKPPEPEPEPKIDIDIIEEGMNNLINSALIHF